MLSLDKISRLELEDATEFLHRRFTFITTVDLVIQLGSGQKPDGLLDEDWGHCALQEMPGLVAETSVARHNLELLWGTVSGVKVLVLSGRFHLYEGYGRVPCILPIWAAARCGARNFFFGNAAGGIRADLEPGTFMLVTDHINNLGISALAGHQHLLKSPYVDMGSVYDAPLTQSLMTAARHENLNTVGGVYQANLGPQFETRAEVEQAARLGADAVGMSTVLEATVAHALGARVAAVSVITNRAAGLGPKPLTHDDVVTASRVSGRQLIGLLRFWLSHGAKALL